jgi:hypothetical protein
MSKAERELQRLHHEQSLAIELAVYHEAARFMRAGMTAEKAIDTAQELWLMQNKKSAAMAQAPDDDDIQGLARVD